MSIQRKKQQVNSTFFPTNVKCNTQHVEHIIYAY